MTGTKNPNNKKWYWLLVIMSIAGTILVNFKQVEGLYIWIGTDVGWIYINLKEKITAQAVLWIVYMLLAIHGAILWSMQ